MNQRICYTIKGPKDFNQMRVLYDSLVWNSINLTTDELKKMCEQSWYTLYAFDADELVGTARVISDGIITATICGVGVAPAYQSKGIGKELMNRIIKYCEKQRVIPQLMCVDSLKPYYESLGFEEFATAMVKRINR
ncbi:GNAT family N-acetyltransferase [Bacillus sp. 1780r2a1]|nr:GNAT family N-acetyltransferase [Bacillus sp. 1780r2a1]